MAVKAWNSGKLLYVAKTLNEVAIILWVTFMPGAAENQPKRDDET
jgi:hypothetical protein